MSDVWTIYYNHWAKENNTLRKEIFRKKSIEKTIYVLWEFFCFYQGREKFRFPSSQKELVDEVKMLVYTTYDSPRLMMMEQMTYLKILSEKLCPIHVPMKLDTFETMFFTKEQKRFMKNLGVDRKFFYDHTREFQTDNYRMIDAILALPSLKMVI